MTDADTDQQAAFRTYATALYGKPGVEATCLTLQDEQGADIPLALICCWVGGHGVRLSTEALQSLDQAIKPWRETVVMPLRDLRRRMKASIGGIAPETAAACRETVKGAELEAELLALDHLVAVLEHLSAKDGRAADRPGIARGNLLRYLGVLGVRGEAIPRDAIEDLLEAAFPGSGSA